MLQMPMLTALRNQLDLPDNKKIILYSGNIGEKQGLENVIEAADRLRDEPLIFAICRAGRRQSAAGKNGAAAWTAQHAIFPAAIV